MIGFGSTSDSSSTCSLPEGTSTVAHAIRAIWARKYTDSSPGKGGKHVTAEVRLPVKNFLIFSAASTCGGVICGGAAAGGGSVGKSQAAHYGAAPSHPGCVHGGRTRAEVEEQQRRFGVAPSRQAAA
eukprot:3271192-Prymnesium_polylepis.1